MIWTIEDVSGFLSVVKEAGDPDQAAIAAYLRRSRRPQHAPKYPDQPRYYYLLADDPRIVIACIGTPLADWRGSAMCLVGTREIIGEFAGNRHLVGRKGLHLRLSPLAWLEGAPDHRFANASEAIEAISFQVLDLDRIERHQRAIQRKYEWGPR